MVDPWVIPESCAIDFAHNAHGVGRVIEMGGALWMNLEGTVPHEAISTGTCQNKKSAPPSLSVPNQQLHHTLFGRARLTSQYSLVHQEAPIPTRVEVFGLQAVTVENILLLLSLQAASGIPTGGYTSEGGFWFLQVKYEDIARL